MAGMSQAERNLYEFLKRQVSPDVRELNADLLKVFETVGNAAANAVTAAYGAESPQNATERRRNATGEEDMQIELFRLIDAEIAANPATPLVMAYAIPNGGARSKRTAGRMKAAGVRRGVLDLNLDVARGGYHGLRIELKRPGAGPTAEQRQWIERYVREGYLPLICYSAESAFNTMLDYLGERWKA